MTSLFNFAAFQLGWFVTILGAASGNPWIGIVYTGVWLSIHVSLFSATRRTEVVLLLTAGVMGYAADSALVLVGMLTFPVPAQLGGPSTIWMTCLWMGFAATLRHSLRWLQGRYVVCASLGVLGGPFAYWAGSRLGAVELPGGVFSLMAIALVWLLMMPTLMFEAVRLDKSAGSTTPALRERSP